VNDREGAGLATRALCQSSVGSDLHKR
jgi:hypothetical protein